MKKLMLLALTALMMVGCDVKQSSTNTETSENINRLGYDVIVLDNCEYILGYRKIAHKGNCRFCEERDSIKWEKRKKELEEFWFNNKKKSVI